MSQTERYLSIYYAIIGNDRDSLIGASVTRATIDHVCLLVLSVIYRFNIAKPKTQRKVNKQLSINQTTVNTKQNTTAPNICSQ